MSKPAQVGKHYVLGLLQLSSCFRGEVCPSMPCACAQSLLDEIGKPLHAEIKRLRAALKEISEMDDGIDYYALFARRALEQKP